VSPGDDPGRVYEGAVALFRGADGGAGGGLTTSDSSSTSEMENNNDLPAGTAPSKDNTPPPAVMVLPLDIKAWRAGSMFVM